VQCEDIEPGRLLGEARRINSMTIVVDRDSDGARMKESSHGTSVGGRRVLIVEDEMLISMLLEDMLVDLGHVVVGIVPRVEEALLAVEKDDFDVAILDVHLNGKSALPVAEALAARKRPFVFATGYGARGLPEQFRSRPTLQKPFAREDLDRVLRSLPA